MTASASSEDRTVLLLLPSRREVVPLSTAAYRQAQATRRELADDYRDALILDPQQGVRRIERITVLGPWGDSFGRRLLSRLTSGWRIEVTLSEPLPIGLDEIKRLVAESLQSSPSSVDSLQIESPQQLQEVLAAMAAASSLGALLGALKLPAPEDALDVL